MLIEKKKKGITLKTVFVLFFILVVNTLILPDYHVWDILINSVSSILSIVVWIFLIDVAAKLYDDNAYHKVGLLQIVAEVGLLYYILMFIFYSLATLYPDSDFSRFIDAVGGFYPKAHYGPAYNWCYRLNKYMSIFNICLKALMCITLVNAFNASLESEYKCYKRFKIIEIVNYAWVLLMLVMLFSSWNNELLVIFFIAYILFLLSYIIYIKKYLHVSDIRKNGSIFNRIPEEEYQDFLEKMK